MSHEIPEKKSRNFFSFSQNFFNDRYVTFTSASVSVDLKKFLATEKGKETVRGAIKRAGVERKLSGKSTSEGVVDGSTLRSTRSEAA